MKNYMARNRINFYKACLFVLIIFYTNQSFAQEEKEKMGNLTIFAENNTALALVKIARSYLQQEKSIVSINFKYSFELIQDLDSGEPADIFISSHKDWISALKQKGLVDIYNISDFAKDNLVLVTSANNKKIDIDKIRQQKNINEVLSEINRQQLPLIVDSEYTSVGRYTNEIIKNANIKNHRIFRKFSEDKKSVLDFIDESREYCGIVLQSLVANNNKIRILRVLDNSKIDFQGLVIAGSNMGQAREFLKFLESEDAKEILTSNGFETPKPNLN